MSKLEYPEPISPHREKLLINLQDGDAPEHPSTLEEAIDRLSPDLRKWSLQIFDFAEIAMEEFKTHDLIAQIFESAPGPS